MASPAEVTPNLAWTTLDRDAVIDKVRGVLFGAALGDAIGLATEFLPRWQAIRVYGSEHPTFAFGGDAALPSSVPFHIDQHRVRWTTGDFTDDTDQQLLILFSFLRSGGTTIDPKDFATRLRIWVQQGLRCLDKPACGIGKTTGSIVTDKNYESDPVGTARQYWERTGRVVAPNGAVMRTAIIGALLAPKGMEAVQNTTESIASTTHADPRCIVSSVIVTRMIHEILTGSPPSTDLLQTTVQTVANHYLQPPDISESDIPTAKEELSRFCFPPSIEALEIDKRESIGYTYRTLGCATWCLTQLLSSLQHNPSSSGQHFKSLITTLTMQGGDADTNGAVAGALMGCLVGYSGLPKEWLQGLIHHDWLMKKVDAALELMGVLEGGGYNPQADDDTLLDGGRGFLSEKEMERRDMEMMAKMAILLYPDQGRAKKGESKECVVM
ncbi:hypothetical protein HDV00_012181 [Rhizophlyctis rosea]|nr:hypothetical protein HDV00_012181 [Rhizophlyctis rosea]